MSKIKLQVNDTVVVLRGKNRGQSGKIVKVLPKAGKVVVDGINVVKKHRKPTQATPQGGIIEVTKAVWVHNVGLQDPKDKTKTVKVGYKVEKDGKKVRINKKTGKEIK